MTRTISNRQEEDSFRTPLTPFDVLEFIEKLDDLPYDAASDPGPGE